MANLKSVPAPAGLFPGQNFMTPRICGYYKLRGGYAELSEGEGFNHQPIWGVTIKPDNEHKLSQMFYSRTEAVKYIESLS